MKYSIFLVTFLLASFTLASAVNLVDKTTGERIGPLKPNIDIRIANRTYSVVEAEMIKSSVFSTPEDALKAYLECEYWQDRIAVVFDSENASKAMAEQYRNTTTSVRARYYKIPSNYTTLSSDTNARLYTVNFDGSESKYVVRKTDAGFKVDWLASKTVWDSEKQQEQMDKIQQIKDDFKLGNATLHIKVERVSQSRSYAKIHIRLKNSSQAHLGYWKIDAVVFDHQGKYLGHAYTNGENLRPDADVYGDISFGDIQANQVGSWKLTIGGLTIEDSKGNRLSDGEKYFTLEEVKK